MLESFFIDRLQQQRNASAHTIAAYRDTFRLLLTFAKDDTRKAPSDLDLADLDVSFLVRFLAHLEKTRRNTIPRETHGSPPCTPFRYVGPWPAPPR
jgi:site-specific recombinase XerD